MGGILNQGNPGIIGHGAEGGQVARHPAPMDANERPGLTRDLAIGIVRIDVPGCRIHVRPNNTAPALQNRLVRGHAGHGRRHYIPAWANPRQAVGQMKRRSPGVRRHNIGRPQIFGEASLEFIDLRALANIAGQQHFPEGKHHVRIHSHAEEMDHFITLASSLPSSEDISSCTSPS